MSSPWVAIVNPAGGGGRCGRRADAAIAQLRSEGLAIEVERTTGPGDATRIAREHASRGARRFLAIGGDGTSFEIVNGLFGEGELAPAPDPYVLAMLPLGTGNSFLRDFGITDAAAAMRAVVRGTLHPCDVLRIEHRASSTRSTSSASGSPRTPAISRTAATSRSACSGT
jgi:diacylglycerol kinase (ATP)